MLWQKYSHRNSLEEKEQKGCQTIRTELLALQANLGEITKEEACQTAANEGLSFEKKHFGRLLGRALERLQKIEEAAEARESAFPS